MSIRKLALVAAVIVASIGFAGKADAQVVYTSYYTTPVVYTTEYATTPVVYTSYSTPTYTPSNASTFYYVPSSTGWYWDGVGYRYHSSYSYPTTYYTNYYPAQTYHRRWWR